MLGVCCLLSGVLCIADADHYGHTTSLEMFSPSKAHEKYRGPFKTVTSKPILSCCCWISYFTLVFPCSRIEHHQLYCTSRTRHTCVGVGTTAAVLP